MARRRRRLDRHGDRWRPVAGELPRPPAPGTTVTLDAGAYTVDADGPVGYSQTLSPDCAGTIAPGETKTCTITNDDQPATLVVINEVVNDNGGTASPPISRSPLMAPTHLLTTTFSGPGVAGHPRGPRRRRLRGDRERPAGYSQHALGGLCLHDRARRDQNVHDHQRRPTGDVDVVKEVVNDNDGRAAAKDFTITVTGANPTPASFSGRGCQAPRSRSTPAATR